MTAPVEARSISNLTELFSNPPQYPRNPTHEAHSPLVLYIIRVPGSKDVFLSPIRPVTKASISLEALQSSLYYLHVDTAEDDGIRQSLKDAAKNDENNRELVLRKPLPLAPFANYPASDRPSTPPKSYPHFQPQGNGANGETQLGRLTARGSHLRIRSEDGQAVKRKPIGARPYSGQQDWNREGHRFDGGSVVCDEHAANSKGRPATIPKKPIPWSSRFGTMDEVGDRNETSEDDHNEMATKTPALTMCDVPSITLIRRDPISGSQWNVGWITFSEPTDPSSTLRPVDVEISTPGYAKFVGSGHIKKDEPSFFQSQADVDSAKTNFHHGLRRTVDFRPLPTDMRPPLKHIRTNSSDIMGNFPRSSANKVRQIYTFNSLWDGVCTFSNGVDGRTLRCRHSLPSHSSSDEPISAAVAEVRFNLPWSALRQRDPHKANTSNDGKLPISSLVGNSAKTQWRRSVQQLKHKSWQLHSSSDDDHTQTPPTLVPLKNEISDDSSNEDGRISLKLGREKAGGGFRGDSAKLGKLIIEDEGLKMCDLVVAACMGVWWQHYGDMPT